jgi:hypothetical protein
MTLGGEPASDFTEAEKASEEASEPTGEPAEEEVNELPSDNGSPKIEKHFRIFPNWQSHFSFPQLSR